MLINKKTIKNLSFVFVFAIILGVFLYFSIPANIILPEHSQTSIRAFPICSVTDECEVFENKPQILQNSEAINISSKGVGEYNYQLKLFNKIPFKNVSVSVVPKKYVIPSGEAVGVKMFTKGLLVVFVSSVISEDGQEFNPASDAGIKENDIILAADETELKTNEQLAEYINCKKDTIKLKILREDEEFETDISPIKSNSNDYKIGLWVRDSTAGIGTLTYYDPQNGKCAALGHAITDADTGVILKPSKGELLNCDILSVNKGKAGVAGVLMGSFENEKLGEIITNNEFGIYGTLDKIQENNLKPYEVATRFQVKEGPAKILCELDSSGVKEYNIQIERVSKEATVDNKGIIIRVTDEELLKKTGGIVQGMSGSPILQNGKIVGAVTHVFVNDPTRGYGIFIENMLAEAEKIK